MPGVTGRRGMFAAALGVLLGAACGDSAGESSDAVTTRAPETTATAPSTTAPAAADSEAIERKLVEEQRKRTANLAVGEATCPGGAPTGDPGAAVVCTVQVEGVEVPFTVTLLGAGAEIEGAQRSYEFRPAKPMVDVAGLASRIRTEAATQLGVPADGLAVECGAAKVLVLEVGGTIPCTVRQGSTTRRLQATVSDVNGSTTIKEV